MTERAADPDSLPGAPSPFPSLPNWRDLGYWPAGDGKMVKPKTVYRTAEFEHTSAADLKAVGELGLITLVDLRTAGERAACPDPVYPDVGPLWLDILKDVPATGGANPTKYVSDPAAIKALTPELAQQMMIDTYRQLIESDSAQKYYSEFYQLMLADDLTPTAFHCTTGKDRTGWAAASFLSLLGVAKKDVYTDYLLTNERLLPALEPLTTPLIKVGAHQDAINAMIGVQNVYLDTAFGLVESGWGGLSNYFDKALGIDTAAQQELRARYLVAG